jgi:hypothetical protein
MNCINSVCTSFGDMALCSNFVLHRNGTVAGQLVFSVGSRSGFNVPAVEHEGSPRFALLWQIFREPRDQNGGQRLMICRAWESSDT